MTESKIIPFAHVRSISFGGIVEVSPREEKLSRVCFYNKHDMDLKGGQVKKAEHLLTHKCIQYIGDDIEFAQSSSYICLPLNTKETYEEEGKIFTKKAFDVDYNFSAYKLRKNGKTLHCTCQGYKTRENRGEIIAEGANCSHTLALYKFWEVQAEIKRNEKLLGVNLR